MPKAKTPKPTKILQPSDYVQDGEGFDHIRHFMKPEYLDAGHNDIDENTARNYITDPKALQAFNNAMTSRRIKSAKEPVTEALQEMNRTPEQPDHPVTPAQPVTPMTTATQKKRNLG